MERGDRDLAGVALRERLDLPKIRSIMKQVATAIKHLHSSGVIHADIKLLNLLRCGDQDWRLIDLDAAVVVGDTYRAVLNQDQEAVRPYGDATGSFLIAGQIRGDRPRLFQMYPAGNFIEATPRTQFLQIGETKYGKPILDRALHFDSSIAHSAKLALLSFDATIRSNLSIGPPIDLLCYKKDSFSTDGLRKYSGNDEAWESIREAYSTGLMNVLENIPNPVTGVD